MRTPIAVLFFTALTASACPVCNTETGQEVRAGIFNENFTSTLAATMAPLPVLLASMFAAVHWLGKERKEP